MIHTRPGIYGIHWYNGYWEARLDANMMKTYIKTPHGREISLNHTKKSHGLGDTWFFIRPLTPKDDFEETGVE